MKMRTHSFHALGGPCSLQYYCADEAQAARAAATVEAEVRRIEYKYSRYREDSLLSRINAAAGSDALIEVDAETSALLDYAHAAWEQSDGLFDATSGVLRRAWDFKAQRVPSQSEIEALLPLIGWERLERHEEGVRLSHAGMQLDFGGFGKEYAADRAAAVLRAHGIACGLVELGGDIAVAGPHPDGAPWRIGIRHPRAPQTAVAMIEVAHGGLASSGDYERFFERDGRRYNHVLNPRSGWPVQGALASVSVLARQCLVAGTATTIAMLKGDDGVDWLQTLGAAWLGVRSDGTVTGTLGASQ